MPPLLNIVGFRPGVTREAGEPLSHGAPPGAGPVPSCACGAGSANISR
jgi:hypothetical protein